MNVILQERDRYRTALLEIRDRLRQPVAEQGNDVHFQVEAAYFIARDLMEEDEQSS